MDPKSVSLLTHNSIKFEEKLRAQIPRCSTISEANFSIECGDATSVYEAEFYISCGKQTTGNQKTQETNVFNSYTLNLLSEMNSGNSNSGYPKNDLFIRLWRQTVAIVNIAFLIRNFKIDYEFTYPTYTINAEVAPMRDGISTTTPGEVKAISENFEIGKAFDVGLESKTYKLQAIPNYGFIFDKWQDGSVSDTKTWTIKDTDLNAHTTSTSMQTATFKRLFYSITSPNVNGGSVTGTGSYQYEENITITAVPSYGYHFVKWKEDNSTNPTRSIKVTENLTLTPEFALNTYSITTAFSPEGAGTVTGAKTYTHGNKVELVATPKIGYQLLGWKKNQGSDIILNPLQGETQTIDNHEAYSYNKIVFNAKEAASYTAIFRKVYITYDSIFSLSKWVENGISSSGISEATIFPTEGAPEGFKLKALRNDGYSKQSLTIPVQKGMTYRFDCDIEGTNYEIFFFHCPTRYENSWNQRPSGSQYNVFNTQSGTFTALENYISIRCDSNISGEEITFSNFRIYPEGENYKHFSNSVNAQVRSDEMTWSPPNPKRRGFTFLGWYTGPLGTGEKIFSKEDLNSEITRVFPLHDMVLYSHWENSSSTTFRVTFSMRNTIQVDQT